MAKAIDAFNNRSFNVAGNAGVVLNKKQIDSGMAFLTGELEKRDNTLNEPLTSTTYARDIVINTGGGWVETTSNMFADYAGSGDNTNGLIRGQSNNIPIIQTNVSKDVFKVYPWSNVLKVNYIDQQKLQGIGRPLDNMLDNGIKLNYHKTLDYMTYEGIPEDEVYGLINNPNITVTLVSTGASGDTSWEKKTADEILMDINLLITKTWAQSEYDLSGMANHILIPPEKFTILATRKVSEAADKTILKYVLENNIAAQKGRNLVIDECRWCIGAGTSGKHRMLGYVNDKNRTELDLPVPITRAMTETSGKDLCYYTPFVANIGQVKFLYHQCAMYADGI